jgi:predicted dehydrogenase
MPLANSNLQVACIGFGIMGQGDCRTAASLSGVKLTAVADVYDGRLRKAKEVYGNDTFTTRDYREIIARKDIDAVIVATPDHWHSRIAIDAMEAGKDVYCQKPMVQRIEEGHPVIAAQKKTGRILQVGSQRVSSVIYQKAREIVASGAIGKVHMVEAWLDRNSSIGAWQYSLPPDASPSTVDWDRFLGSAPKRPFEPTRLFRWRNYQDYGTGVGGDLFVHLFSGIHLIMDSLGPSRVITVGGLHYWKDGRDVPDLMLGLYDYAETKSHPAFQLSLRVNFESGVSGEGQGFRFLGTEGVLAITGQESVTVSRRPREAQPGHTFDTFDKANRDRGVAEYTAKYPPRNVSSDSMRGALEERYSAPPGYTSQRAHHEVFADAVRNRKPVVEDAEFGFRAAAPALLSNVSYFERRICHWDPVRMETVKDETGRGPERL